MQLNQAVGLKFWYGPSAWAGIARGRLQTWTCVIHGCDLPPPRRMGHLESLQVPQSIDHQPPVESSKSRAKPMRYLVPTCLKTVLSPPGWRLAAPSADRQNVLFTLDI
jgi:hypothetical protein